MAGDKLYEAIKISYLLHDKQKDKCGKPYFFHPMYVAMQLDDETEQIVALLHDVVEDTDLTVQGIRGIFDDKIADAIDAISRREGEKYFEYIKRVKENELACKVKIEDIKHNMLPDRLSFLNKTEAESLKKRYTKALSILKDSSEEEFL